MARAVNGHVTIDGHRCPATKFGNGEVWYRLRYTDPLTKASDEQAKTFGRQA